MSQIIGTSDMSSLGARSVVSIGEMTKMKIIDRRQHKKNIFNSTDEKQRGVYAWSAREAYNAHHGSPANLLLEAMGRGYKITALGDVFIIHNEKLAGHVASGRETRHE